MSTATLVIVEVVSSQIDRNGNRYHFARFYNPEKGRQYSVVMEVGGESNARSVALEYANGDYEAMLCFERSVPKSDFKRMNAGVTLYEGSADAEAALDALFDVKG